MDAGKNPKLAIDHALSAIRPHTLKSRLESDLELSYIELKHDFKGFMEHILKLADAFQLIGLGRVSSSSTGNNKQKGSTGGGKKKSDNDATHENNNEKVDKKSKYKRKKPIN